jgi:hypothetical protein
MPDGQKNPNFGIFKRNGKCWRSSRSFLYLAVSPLVHFKTMLWLFGVFPPILVCCTKKNLANLHEGHMVIGLLRVGFQKIAR